MIFMSNLLVGSWKVNIAVEFCGQGSRASADHRSSQLKQLFRQYCSYSKLNLTSVAEFLFKCNGERSLDEALRSKFNQLNPMRTCTY